MKYKLRKLSNGVRLLTVPSEDAESVVVDVFVTTGSRSESAKESGLSHFLEHFLFKGTQKYPTAMAISELVDGIGGEQNANTGKEHTQYYIKAGRKHLPLLFDILTDMVQRPLLDKEELEREKGVIVEELNMYKDMPQIEVENVLEGAMWKGQALGRDIGGTKEVVQKFTVAMFQEYLKKFYQSSGIIIGVGGKFSDKQVWQLAQKYWGKVPARRAKGYAPAVTRQNRPQLAVSYKKTEQSHLAFGFRGLHANHPDRFAAGVLATILGGGMSSRLFHQVRERRGLAYYVRASHGSYQDTGVFMVKTGVKVEKAEEAVKVVLEELKKIKQKSVPLEELAKAKEFMKGKTQLALEDNQTKLDWYLEQVAFSKKVLSPKEAFARVEKVTPRQVQDVARKILTRKNLTFAGIGPYKNDTKFKKLIHGF